MRNKTQKYFLRKILAIVVLFIASFFCVSHNNNVSAITIESLDYTAPEYDRILGNYNAFDIRGKINGGADYNFKTTYAHAGYSIDYTIDGANMVWRNVENGAELSNQNVVMTLVTTKTGSGGVDVKLTMANPEDNGEREYKVAITSDVQIGSNDYAAIYKNGMKGLVATQDDTRYPSDYGAQIFIDFSPEVQTLWIGPYNNRLANKFNNSAVSKYTVADRVDTGSAWSWQGTLAAGENKELITSFNLVETEKSTIRFYGADGELIKEEEALVGGAISLPGLSAGGDGYTHVWNTANDGSGASYRGGDSIIVESEEIDFYEVMLPDKYTISYDLNGGHLPEGAQKEYTIEDDFVLAEPEREGYTFAGWTGANGDTPEREVRISGDLGDKNYTANWTVNQYTLTFDTNGGSEVEDITQDYGTELELPTTSKIGYEFDGWYTDTEFGSRYTGTTIPAGDVTLHAKWVVNQYVLRFDLGEGEVLEIVGDYGESVEVPEEPEREGYVFAGWYVGDIRVALDGYVTVPAEDVEIRAEWKEIPEPQVIIETVERIVYVFVAGASSEDHSTGVSSDASSSSTSSAGSWSDSRLVEEARDRVEEITEDETEEPEAIAPLGVIGHGSGASGKKGVVDAVVEYLRWIFCWILGGVFFWFILLPFKRRKEEEEEEEEE